jgi:two-component system, OmpR family, sensor histidine kinase ArlS
MKKIVPYISQMPIRWKLTFWSAFLLCFLFLVYSSAQYFVVNQWLMKREQTDIQKNMDEILGFYHDNNNTFDSGQMKDSLNFIQRINQRNQLIRILDTNGKPVITVTSGVPSEWINTIKVSQPQLSDFWHDQDHLLVMRSPLNAGSFNGVIEIANNLENFDSINNILLLVLAVGGLTALFLSVLGGLIVARRMLLPIRSMTETMSKIKKQGMDERVIVVENRDEISSLAKMFNEMMDQLELSFRQQKQFVEDASHELRTPISIIEGHLALLNRWGKKDPEILEESLTTALQETNRLKGLIQDLLELSQAESSVWVNSEWIEAAAVIESVVEKVSTLYPNYHFQMDIKDLAGVKITINPNHLEQILIILLDNAVKYSLNVKAVQLVGYIQDKSLSINVIDFGIGIPKEDLPYVFQRFYRVDKARTRETGGHGLGLAIAKHLVEKYEGTIQLSSEEKKGTHALIRLPVTGN